MQDTIRVRDVHRKIDFAILTIRPDEFQAVQARFKPDSLIVGGDWNYFYRRFVRSDGSALNVVLVRHFEQGHKNALTVALHTIKDLRPKFLILTGIAGGFPTKDFSLGDVVIATSLFDFSVGAEIQNKRSELRTEGGQFHPKVTKLIAALPAYSDAALGNWNSRRGMKMTKPALAICADLDDDNVYYGRKKVREKVCESLQANFKPPVRRPCVALGVAGTSNTLVKHASVMEQWQRVARHLNHVEMELGGVYSAVREHGGPEIPLLSIRGISDVVGLHRAAEWTGFACHSAASYVHAILDTLPTELLGLPKPKTGTRGSSQPIKKQSESPSVAEIKARFIRSSVTLTSHAVPASDRIPREELEEFEKMVATDSAKLICLLGSPGSGKTALLALAAQNAIKKGVATFTLKADLLPSKPLEQWGKQEMGIPITPLDAIKALAADGRVLVVVDQLDALSSTVDLKSTKLDRVLKFITECSKLPNVSVICSCRTFDYQHDTRFGVLNPVPIELKLPEWTEVVMQLEKNGVKNSDSWPASFRELLRTPQHLRIFLDHFRETGKSGEFSSYHLMLDELWQRNVSKNDLDFLYELTAYLMKTESLWAPFARFEEYKSKIIRLESKQILKRQDGSVGFYHQTLLEHAKARHFARKRTSVSSYILKRQNAIFVRPTAWAVLQYLRDASLAQYQKEIEKLFAADLRLHMRYLLIEFLGTVTQPKDFEVPLLAACLKSDDDRIRALIAMRGKAGWFDALKKSHLPAVMQLPLEKQWPMTEVLGGAWDTDRDTCLSLVETYWLNDPTKDGLTWGVMRLLGEWDDQAVEIVCALVRRMPADENHSYRVESVIEVISANKPDLAPRVFIEAANRFYLTKEVADA